MGRMVSNKTTGSGAFFFWQVLIMHFTGTLRGGSWSVVAYAAAPLARTKPFNDMAPAKIMWYLIASINGRLRRGTALQWLGRLDAHPK